MSAQKLTVGDSYGRKLHLSEFGGQLCITPIVEKIGDTIALDDSQAHFLLLYLQEHFGLPKSPDLHRVRTYGH